mmetsp:Transcript_24025/g.48618  ORF Transcript_24025/g.48618 Transcript_24025/m.48618 type:complete len:183 (-) Transcript_24025:104-652(-)|eukprot:CAMPEP_0183295076 /NCGR_PEP_ID=MMETSP0160_2-20130417/3172_1 /TAXON_ID=2839 ORGANISM="Odontella Sinensis, Strain Grunow 1884" /NCGR_SAMPLE_ID=MMETSP0160_2 /ASSEMBLY_ACC=CAM_ASM_000250 /LENGTH=182 /DNA_ID=CAMNT_0025456497 /DNA_START=63 /DNA_END=614 /DNA_ORIENTATION=+
MALQKRFDDAMKGGAFGPHNSVEMNHLAQELAETKETHALIRIWDKLKDGGCSNDDPATRVAINKLHSRGKGKIPTGTLKVAAVPNELNPARRLHKICKGAVLSERSESAREHLDAACRVVEALRAEKHGGGAPYPGGKLEGRQKFELVAVLKRELGVTKNVARGIVTKLKQTRRGKDLLFR